MAFSLPNPFLTLHTILKLNHGYTFAVVPLVSRYLSVKLPLEYRRFFEKEREREREEKNNVKFRIRWVTYYKIPFLELRTFDSSNSAFHAFRPIFLQLCLQYRPIE